MRLRPVALALKADDLVVVARDQIHVAVLVEVGGGELERDAQIWGALFNVRAKAEPALVEPHARVVGV